MTSFTLTRMGAEGFSPDCGGVSDFGAGAAAGGGPEPSDELELDEDAAGAAGEGDLGVCASNTPAHKKAVKAASFEDRMKGFACLNYSDETKPVAVTRIADRVDTGKKGDR